jgi:hypothetical protein
MLALLERRDLRARTTDPRVSLEILKDEAKLSGLYPAEKQKHEVTGANGAPLLGDTLTLIEYRGGDIERAEHGD